MSCKGIVKSSAAVILSAALAMAGPGAVFAESVNWVMTVSAEESYNTQEVWLLERWTGLSSQGSIGQNYPPAGTTQFDLTVDLIMSGYPNASVSFKNIPNTNSYYSVWYGYLGSHVHRVILFGGSVGGAVLDQTDIYADCGGTGFGNMKASFSWFVESAVIRTISASDAGTLTGGLGETKTAPWSAAPAVTAGASVSAYRQSFSSDNPIVTVNYTTDASGTAGTVSATFPACSATPEVCDGIDNDCNGLVDETAALITCGVGICNNAVMSCSGGQTYTCDPMKGASAETCDGIDNDCDGVVDNGCTAMDFAPTQLQSLSSTPGITPKTAGKLDATGSLLTQAKAAAAAGDMQTWARLMDRAVANLDQACADLGAACATVGNSLARYSYDTGSAAVNGRDGAVSPSKLEAARLLLSDASSALQSGDYKGTVDKVNAAVRKVY